MLRVGFDLEHQDPDTKGERKGHRSIVRLVYPSTRLARREDWKARTVESIDGVQERQ